ncbi:MAG TPA: hypothetical protein PKC18_16735, partial [Lacipirellulaceae bacterium]|nr:hypothetical protein [Lacipirellulaceae bacterium]
ANAEEFWQAPALRLAGAVPRGDDSSLDPSAEIDDEDDDFDYEYDYEEPPDDASDFEDAIAEGDDDEDEGQNGLFGAAY